MTPKEYVQHFANHEILGLHDMDATIRMWCMAQGYIEPVIYLHPERVLIELTETGKLWLGLHDVSIDDDLLAEQKLADDVNAAFAAVGRDELQSVINDTADYILANSAPETDKAKVLLNVLNRLTGYYHLPDPKTEALRQQVADLEAIITEIDEVIRDSADIGGYSRVSPDLVKNVKKGWVTD